MAIKTVCVRCNGEGLTPSSFPIVKVKCINCKGTGKIDKFIITSPKPKT